MIDHLLQWRAGEILQGFATVALQAGTDLQLTAAGPGGAQLYPAAVGHQLATQSTALIQPQVQRRSIEHQTPLQLLCRWPVRQIAQLRLRKLQVQLGTGAVARMLSPQQRL